MPTVTTYPQGQCTWWVASHFPWIGPYWHNAEQWLSSAVSAGLTVGKTPLPNSVAVWGANMGGATGDGHVAIVTGIQANGLPIVSESNWTYGTSAPDVRAVSADSASGIIGYIYPPGTAGGSTDATLTAATLPSGWYRKGNLYCTKDQSGEHCYIMPPGSNGQPNSGIAGDPNSFGEAQLRDTFLAKIGQWLTDPTHWWSIAFVAAGGILIIGGIMVFRDGDFSSIQSVRKAVL